MARVRLEERVHTFQIDVNDHVSNIAYVQWLEVARVRLLERAGLAVEAMQAEGRDAVVVETWIKHLAPLHFPDRVGIEVWVSELAAASIWLDFELASVARGRLVARARQRAAFVERRTARPHRLSATERESLARFLDGPHPA